MTNEQFTIFLNDVAQNADEEGNRLLNLANFGLNVGHTTDTGSYPDGVSPYGLHDKSGNAWEWCWDWFAMGYYPGGTLSLPGEYPSEIPRLNLKGPETGMFIVIRGGPWVYRDLLDTTARWWDAPMMTDKTFGFRCAWN